MRTDFGLKQEQLKEIREILGKHPEIEKAVIFGSRAKGDHKKGSDIDIAVFGDNISIHTILSLMSDFEESSLPFFVDIVDFKGITDKKLRSEIEKNGIEITV